MGIVQLSVESQGPNSSDLFMKTAKPSLWTSFMLHDALEVTCFFRIIVLLRAWPIYLNETFIFFFTPFGLVLLGFG